MSSNGYISGKPDISWWIQQVNAGIAFRKKQACEESWSKWNKMYRGDWNKGILPTNLFFKMMRTIVPRVYFRNPSVSIQPEKPGMEQWAFSQLQERLDNKIIKKMKIKQQIKAMVQDGFLRGTGIGKLGFGALYTPTTNMRGFANEDPINKKRQRVEYHSRVQPNMPWFVKVNTGNFIVPAGCESLDAARWVAEWQRRSLSDVQDDPRLKNTKDLKATSRASITGQGAVNTFDIKDSVEMIDLLEIRDKKTGKVFIIAPFATQRLLAYEDDAFQVTGGVNYYPLQFNPDDLFWAIPDAKILEPQQLEANEIRTQMMYHRRIAIARLLVKRGVLKQEEAEKMISEDVMPIVQVDGDPMTDIRITEGVDIPDALFKMENINMGDVRESMGFSRNEFGETSPANARTSKFESQVAKAAGDIRVDERRDTVADMLVDMVGDMHTLMHSEWTEDQIVDIAGPLGMQIWVKFNPQMLRSGAFEVSIDPDNSVSETKEVRTARAQQIYDVLRANPLIDPYQLTRYYLHEMHGVQFDTMLRNPGVGMSQENPMDVGQFMQFQQGMGNAMPQIMGGGR